LKVSGSIFASITSYGLWLYGLKLNVILETLMKMIGCSLKFINTDDVPYGRKSKQELNDVSDRLPERPLRKNNLMYYIMHPHSQLFPSTQVEY
jgi:hypothetical protein